ncbi:hypothetical protein [Notoacmeibacter sp. MSK16QG-6]|uniref:hypothetical protein n=1 Tax=Notoacmeibacter sp. MSK16QG-6 TaxID=2957982 RepID=UPI00209F537E|nr:hypothetical protein [Notoacmeibacter sp. MSK16QG-6]MCP1200491.1 hypothetical protein [Notoacmeibacter sp. MSK16QG-6]
MNELVGDRPSPGKALSLLGGVSNIVGVVLTFLGIFGDLSPVVGEVSTTGGVITVVVSLGILVIAKSVVSDKFEAARLVGDRIKELKAQLTLIDDGKRAEEPPAKPL